MGQLNLFQHKDFMVRSRCPAGVGLGHRDGGVAARSRQLAWPVPDCAVTRAKMARAVSIRATGGHAANWQNEPNLAEQTQSLGGTPPRTHQATRAGSISATRGRGN